MDLEHAAKVARQVKESLVERTTVDEVDDITPTALIWRDEKLVATIICQQVDRDEALGYCSIAIPAYGADAVTLSFDVHVSEKTGPREGETWKPGQMQTLCDDEGACATGLITDAIATMHMRRDGSVDHVTDRYHVHKEARKVVWFERNVVDVWNHDPGNKEQRFVGLIPDSLRHFFSLPTLVQLAEKELPGLMSGEEFGLTPHEAQLHRDIAMTKILVMQGASVMLAGDSEEDAAIIRASLDRQEGITVEDLIDLAKSK
jgi:hypothetical protein